MFFTLLKRHAVERPQQQAIVSAGLCLTWQQLHDRALRMAAGLTNCGVGPGDSVAIALPNCIDFVNSFASIARIGSVAVPLAIDLKPAEICSRLKASGCRTLLADAHLATLGESL